MMVCCTEVEAKRLIRIKQIDLNNNPCRIEIKLSEKPPYKIIPIGKKELLIALKNVRGTDQIKIKGSAEPLVRKIGVDTPANDVVTVIVNTRQEVNSISPVWDQVRQTLVIPLSETNQNSHHPNKSERRVRLSVKEKTAGEKESLKQEKGPIPTAASVKTQKQIQPAVKMEKPIFSGTIDDFFIELKNDGCLGDKTFFAALKFYETKQWQGAFDTISAFINQQPLLSCLEKAYFVKAFSFYRKMMENDEQQQIEAIDFFQEAINRFPKSDYVPYAYIAVGKIHLHLKNPAQAKGYFNLVLDQYPNYHGIPEALFELGRIYSQKSQKNDQNDAISIFKKIIADYPQSELVIAAKRELGKMMLATNNFSEALKILMPLSESEPHMLYESSDLLLHIGNAYYHTGNSEKARLALSKAYNLFPEIDSKDEVLSRIADSFIEQKQPEKAVKVYEYIIANFPETEGYITGLMRLAQFTEEQAEKERLYNIVIKDFPYHSLARLAMMRLAGLYNEAGEYEKSIEMLENLLKSRPKALKNEALYLMRKAYMLLFRRLLQEENYPSVLARYEENKDVLNKLESAEIFRLVGQAYMNGHLYQQAFDVLMKAYKRFEKGRRPADLMYNLGVVMQELQRFDEALNMFSALIRNFPESPYIKDAYKRRGTILLAKHGYKEAIKNFQAAYRRSTDDREKADILTNEAQAHKALGNLQAAAGLLIKVINQLASASAEHFKMIAETYRSLGEIYLELESYQQAADAFSMSVKFSGKDDNRSEIQFAIGESYQKANVMDKAVRVYEGLIESEDSLWAKLAQERLKEIELKAKLEQKTKVSMP